MTHTLVTGTSGFVGRALVAELLARGISVRGAARRAIPLPSGVECSAVGEVGVGTDWHDALMDATSVVHLAARAHVLRDTTIDPLATFRAINTEGTLNLARQAAEAGVCRFVFVSTIKVNGEGRDAPYAEFDLPSPQNPYAISKWEAEQGLRDIAAHTGMDVTILRPPLVYGPGVQANFLQLMQAVDRGWPLPLSGVNNRRSLIYLDNLTGAIITCLTHPAAAGKTYLVSDGEDVSTAELITRIAQALGKSSRLWPCPLGLMELAGMMTGKSDEVARLLGSLCIDSSKIRSELGWTPPYTLMQGLVETARWFRGRNNRG